jgi:hypothetical protein
VQGAAPDEPAAAAVERARAELARRAGAPGVVAAAVAADPARWTLTHFTLWADEPAELLAAETTYRVLHLSSPGMGALEEGER